MNAYVRGGFLFGLGVPGNGWLNKRCILIK